MKLTIGNKLYSGFGALLLIIIVLVSFNSLKLGELRKLQDTGALRSDVAIETQRANEISYRLYTIIADAQLNGYSDKIRTTFEDAQKECDGILADLEKNSDTDKEKELSKTAEKSIGRAIDLFKNQMVPLFSMRGKPETDNKITQLDEMIDGTFTEARIPLQEFAKSVKNESVEADKLFDKTSGSIVLTSLVLAGIAICLGILVAFFITRGITISINSAVIAIQQLAKGNLTVTFDTKSLSNTDETGVLTRAMKDMTKQLKETISFALDSSENVSSGSTQLSSASQGISQGSSEQAASVEEISASLEEISASIEQMTASINQNADNANQTEKIAMKSSTDAKTGGEAVQKTVSAMKQIAEKISIIQEIARQTNLLSLNASIEAARAGEHGKGFAVVASAVQKLAERSQDAAEEISKLSKSSVDVAEKAGEMLDKLVPDIQKTAELVAEINAASAEQNNGIQQVNTSVQQVNSAIQQFNTVVQSNASASEELASTSEELSSQAEELKNRISFFQIDISNHHQKSDGHKTSKTHATLQAAHITQRPAISNVSRDKQHITVANDSVLDQRSGIAIDMNDDEDSNFQRI